MGHLPVFFTDVPALLAALAGGQRFDLLILPAQGDTTQWQRVAAVCEVLRMPMLLIVLPDPRSAAHLPHDMHPGGAAIDLVASDAPDSELGWRIRALQRRAGAMVQETARRNELVLGDYRFFGAQQLVLLREREIRLQPRQFELAFELFRNAGRVVTRGWLWSALWGDASPREGARALDVCVTNVRKKLDLCRENGFTLRAAYRHGYMLCPVAAISVLPDGPAPSAADRDHN